eukprot:TRINITY_DN3028_c1_g1_i1.p1 TRINITY_DN3028_c1_g1~~TRINITY_DN3028_c1_g1_i1.p1  ORF type:complete len:593 (-),score=100.22 TRINITY_DN3028_c1_g1_i1:194-1972(-)
MARRRERCHLSFAISSMMLIVVVIVTTFGKQSAGFTCSLYQSAIKLNELAFPHNPHYSPDRHYFGAPAICDDLSSNRTFFVPQNGTEKEDVEQQAFATGFGLGVLTEECRIPATKLLCASAFRECEFEQISTSLPNFFVFPLPRPPCRSLCEEMVKGCKDAGIPLPNCTALDSSNEPSYPKSKGRFVVNGQAYNIPCEDYREIPNINNTQLDPVVCPWPLEYNSNHRDEDAPCQVVCPNGNSYTDEEWDNIINIKFAFSIISLVVDIFTLSTLLTLVEKRQFPANLAIAATFVHLVWMVSFVISGSIGQRTVACQDRFTLSTSKDYKYCGVEAASIFWATSCIAYVWACLALNLFILVVLEIKGSQLRFYWIPTYAFSIGFPTITTIVLWSVGEFGYLFQFPWCWFTHDTVSIALFWSWIFAAIAVVIVCIICSFYKMIKVKRRFMSLKRAFKKHLNIFLFLVCFLLVYGFHWINWMWLRFHGNEKFQGAVVDQVACNVASGGQNNCHLEARFRPSTLYFYTALTAGSGLFIWIAWGCNLYYIGHWKRVFSAAFRGDFKSIKRMGLTMASDSNSGTGRSSTRKHTSLSSPSS